MHGSSNEGAAAAATPFACILVPYDGSEPAQAALALALRIATAASRLVILTVVDETPVIGESVVTAIACDPSSLFEALDSQGKAVLVEAIARCAAAKVMPVTELVHDTAVSAIEDAIRRYGADLVVMGTHARTGVARLFLGSTTVGVLRSTRTPVLTVRTLHADRPHPFARVIFGIDDADASDAAVEIAARLARALATTIVACNAIDMSPLYDNGGAYVFDPETVLEEMRAEGNAVIAHSLGRAGIDLATVTVRIVEGNAAASLVESASACGATALILGSHGRRGLRRFVLGSVAEDVVRTSSLPVLVVREAANVARPG